MSETEKRIAKVRDVHLGWEDHGIFTCWLDLDYGDSGQGAGLYALDEWDESQDRRVGTAQGLECIMRLMQVFNVNEWSEIEGRTCYAIATYTKVLGLEPLPTEGGKALMFDELWKETVSP